MNTATLLRRTSAATAPFITSVTPAGLTNAFDGQIGFSFLVGASNLSVTHLGRLKNTGNSLSHLLHLARVSDSGDVAGGSVTVNLSSGAEGEWVYAPLVTPVTLLAATSYYLMSDEVSGGDNYSNPTATFTHTAIADIIEAIYRILPGDYNGGVGLNSMFGPLNFKALRL